MIRRCFFCATSDWKEPIEQVEFHTKYGIGCVGTCPNCAPAIKKNDKIRRYIVQYIEKEYERRWGEANGR